MSQGRRPRLPARRLVVLALALALALLLSARPAWGDVPPVQERTASVLPWSGWWWPLAHGPAPHLDDPDGPLAKYDRYCVATGRPNPQTREWEQAHARTAPPEAHWWGHCHGWAAAAVLEPEPTAAVERSGIAFGVADLKGLLAAWHSGDGAHFVVGGPPAGVSALDFHNHLQAWLLAGGRPLIVDVFRGGGQVWNYPAYQARLEYRAGETAGSLHAVATLTFAGTALPDEVGTRTFTRTYTYWLTGDPQRPAAAEWEGESAGPGQQARPWVLWYPDPALRLPEQVPPGLNPAIIREIISGQSPGTPPDAARAPAVPGSPPGAGPGPCRTC